MRIGELASRTGVSRRMLRYYEQQGLLPAVRGANGYRTYDDDAERRVAHIRALLDAGLSTEVIETVLPCARPGSTTEVALDMCPELARTLRAELARIDSRIEGMQRHRGALRAYLPGEPGTDLG